MITLLRNRMIIRNLNLSFNAMESKQTPQTMNDSTKESSLLESQQQQQQQQTIKPSSNLQYGEVSHINPLSVAKTSLVSEQDSLKFNGYEISMKTNEIVVKTPKGITVTVDTSKNKKNMRYFHGWAKVLFFGREESNEALNMFLNMHHNVEHTPFSDLHTRTLEFIAVFYMFLDVTGISGNNIRFLKQNLAPFLFGIGEKKEKRNDGEEIFLNSKIINIIEKPVLNEFYKFLNTKLKIQHNNKYHNPNDFGNVKELIRQEPQFVLLFLMWANDSKLFHMDEIVKKLSDNDLQAMEQPSVKNACQQILGVNSLALSAKPKDILTLIINQEKNNESISKDQMVSIVNQLSSQISTELSTHREDYNSFYETITTLVFDTILSSFQPGSQQQVAFCRKTIMNFVTTQLSNKKFYEEMEKEGKQPIEILNQHKNEYKHIHPKMSQTDKQTIINIFRKFKKGTVDENDLKDVYQMFYGEYYPKFLSLANRVLHKFQETYYFKEYGLSYVVSSIPDTLDNYLDRAVNYELYCSLVLEHPQEKDLLNNFSSLMLLISTARSVIDLDPNGTRKDSLIKDLNTKHGIFNDHTTCLIGLRGLELISAAKKLPYHKRINEAELTRELIKMNILSIKHDLKLDEEEKTKQIDEILKTSLEYSLQWLVGILADSDQIKLPGHEWLASKMGIVVGEIGQMSAVVANIISFFHDISRSKIINQDIKKLSEQIYNNLQRLFDMKFKHHKHEDNKVNIDQCIVALEKYKHSILKTKGFQQTEGTMLLRGLYDLSFCVQVVFDHHSIQDNHPKTAAEFFNIKVDDPSNNVVNHLARLFINHSKENDATEEQLSQGITEELVRQTSKFIKDYAPKDFEKLFVGIDHKLSKHILQDGVYIKDNKLTPKGRFTILDCFWESLFIQISYLFSEITLLDVTSFIPKYMEIMNCAFQDKSLEECLDTVNTDDFIDYFFNYTNLMQFITCEKFSKRDMVAHFERVQELIKMLKTEKYKMGFGRGFSNMFLELFKISDEYSKSEKKGENNFGFFAWYLIKVVGGESIQSDANRLEKLYHLDQKKRISSNSIRKKGDGKSLSLESDITLDSLFKTAEKESFKKILSCSEDATVFLKTFAKKGIIFEKFKANLLKIFNNSEDELLEFVKNQIVNDFEIKKQQQIADQKAKELHNNEINLLMQN